MLTKEAIQERKWGAYPALRKILEEKELPGRYYGTSSISDNVFDKMNQLLELSFLVQENKSLINFKENKSIFKELVALEKDLKNMVTHIHDREIFISRFLKKRPT